MFHMHFTCETCRFRIIYFLNSLEVTERVCLCTPSDAGYYDTLTLDDDFDEVYQEEKLLSSFIVEPGARLDDLVRDANGIQMSIK
jgi:hypothetical protein